MSEVNISRLLVLAKLEFCELCQLKNENIIEITTTFCSCMKASIEHYTWCKHYFVYSDLN